MTGLPPPGTVLGRLDDLPDPGARAAGWESAPLILARRGGEARCYLDVCPHAGRPLSLPGGRVLVHAGEFLLCPAHGAVFDIATGACGGGPAGASSLKAVPVRVKNGDVVAI